MKVLKMSYLIKNHRLLAVSSQTFVAGLCSYSFCYVKDSMNANFEKVLVNQQFARISNAKKWAAHAVSCDNNFDVCDPYFNRDFLISTEMKG